GHGGGFPGHATRTLLDPRDHLVVVVLVNEIGGPADALARAIVTLIDFALRQPRAPEERAPDPYGRFTGRLVNPWGVPDVARLAAPASRAGVGALVEAPACYPYLSGRENLRVIAGYTGAPAARIEAALAQVDLSAGAGPLSDLLAGHEAAPGRGGGAAQGSGA